MKLPELKIGNRIASIPIVQGGMAVRLSMARLAAAVANEGGIGLIAASGITPAELRYEIRMARAMTDGIVGINIMFAASGFHEMIKTAIAEGIDLVVAGAGFSRDMFPLGQESGTPIVPIVSSVKLAKISQRLGATAIVVEGKEAGGHLGTDQSVRDLIPDICAAVDIPVIAAGGVFTGQDIVDLIKMGASGVQMGSRFAASEESNAAPALKALYLKAAPDDVRIIHSPVGLPGQALRNPFSDTIAVDKVPPKSCETCLKVCSHRFCIMKSLIRAEQGDVETGLCFSGERMARIQEILPVSEIFKRLTDEVAAID